MSWLSEGIHTLGQNPSAIIGGIVSGCFTLAAAGLVTARITREQKRTEFVLEFTKRYHEFRSAQHVQNQKFAEVQASQSAEISEAQRREAKNLYRQLFSLVFDEYYAYKKGFLDREVFIEWMKWRMDDYHGDANYKFEICGWPYKDGWADCSEIGPMRKDPFKPFLEEIHNCKNDYDRVAAVVRRVKPTTREWLVSWMDRIWKHGVLELHSN